MLHGANGVHSVSVFHFTFIPDIQSELQTFILFAYVDMKTRKNPGHVSLNTTI